ncbi:MAG TPA: choice-of-anchor D domain-containing protein, partial [Kofleriaceae bacterium]|nr:choice-of-anchor D domain-containing protein [Kofleriaceae bacterium]
MRVGDTDTIPLTLHNLGAQPIQISTVMFDDPSEFSFATGSDPSATMLGGSADLPTSVVYTPVRATTSGSGSGSGSSSSSDSVTIATLTVNHDSTMSDQVTFQGCAVAAKMSVSPGDNYDVGPVCTNTNTTKTVQFTVSAADVGNFKLTNVSSPDPSSPFSLQSWDGTTEIGPTGMAGSSGSAAINIGVKPLQPGRDTGSFTITTDINVAGDTTRQISLAVTGIGSGVAVTPDSLDFGTASLGQTSLAQMLAVSNCQGSDLNLGAATITGKNANEFSIVIQPTSTTVTNTNSVTYGLVFLPTRSGIGSATLEIDLGNGGPPLTVSLIGAGTSAGESFGSATYYTCTTGGTAGWPIAAVVGFAIARRRRRR